MTPFEYLAGTMMLIVGLGITRLLSGLVDRFRDRQISKPHWIPLAWAIIVFMFQMQFLWAAFELNDRIQTWTAISFLFLLAYSLGLFLAGVLVIPRSNTERIEDAFQFFLKEGKWTLMVIAFLLFWSMIINPLLFNEPAFALQNLADLIGLAILGVTFFMKTKRGWTIGTLAFATYAIVIIILVSPGEYG